MGITGIGEVVNYKRFLLHDVAVGTASTTPIVLPMVMDRVYRVFERVSVFNQTRPITAASLHFRGQDTNYYYVPVLYAYPSPYCPNAVYITAQIACKAWIVYGYDKLLIWVEGTVSGDTIEWTAAGYDVAYEEWENARQH